MRYESHESLWFFALSVGLALFILGLCFALLAAIRYFRAKTGRGSAAAAIVLLALQVPLWLLLQNLLMPPFPLYRSELCLGFMVVLLLGSIFLGIRAHDEAGRRAVIAGTSCFLGLALLSAFTYVPLLQIRPLLRQSTAILRASTRPYDWRTAESTDGRFRASFPAEPTNSEKPSVDVLDGSKFIANELAASPGPGVVYMVSWWENPRQQGKTAEELFQHFTDCDLKVFQGSLLGEQRVEVQGHPAKDIEISAAGGGFIVDNRVLRVGARVYSIWVIEPRSRHNAADTTRFFDSFSLF